MPNKTIKCKVLHTAILNNGKSQLVVYLSTNSSASGALLNNYNRDLPVEITFFGFQHDSEEFSPCRYTSSFPFLPQSVWSYLNLGIVYRCQCKSGPLALQIGFFPAPHYIFHSEEQLNTVRRFHFNLNSLSSLLIHVVKICMNNHLLRDLGPRISLMSPIYIQPNLSWDDVTSPYKFNKEPCQVVLGEHFTFLAINRP